MMVIICREVDKRSGRIAVYEVKKEVTNDLLVNLKLRAMLNPELRYFVMMRKRWEDGAWHDAYYKALKKRSLTDDQIEDMDGIEEVK